MTKKILGFILVPIIIGSAIVFSSYLADQKKDPPQRQKPKTINYVKVQEFSPQPIETNIEAYGRVRSSRQISLITEVGGRMLEGSIPLKKGQNFRKGQLLCRIHSVEQRLTLQSEKSKFLNTLASVLPDLKIDFTDNFKTWEGYFDQIDIEKDLPALPQPKSSKEKTFLAAKNILGEYYAIKSKEENLKKYTIYAPFDGSIESVDFEVGSIVNPGTNIGSILRTDKLELEIPCEIRDIGFVKVGQKVKVISESPIYKEWDGKVVRISDFVDANTQSVAVFISVTNTNKNEIMDGFFLKASIPGKSIKNATRVPRNILKNKNEVFIVKDQKLLTKKVQVHRLSENSAVISGLEPGDQYVVERPSNASENMEVQIIKG